MARRPTHVFSMAFLDVMACGLGAVILFLLIITAQVSKHADRINAEALKEAAALAEQVKEGRENLLKLRKEERKPVNAAGEIERVKAIIARLRAELLQRNATSTAKRESVEDLRADIERLEKANERLSEAKPEPASGTRVRGFVGTGNRQYLTGIKMSGQRVLLLVDGSSSMLARTYVNVVRFRAMSDARKRGAPKWRQAVATVDWLTTQIPPNARFQIYVFNENAHSVVNGTDGTWLDGTKEGELDRAVKALRQYVPDGGTSLINAVQAMKALSPAPDNIFLLTDGLPTQGKSPPDPPVEVRPDQRASLFVQAARDLRGRVPINVILFPMDGDPAAAGLFWELAYVTRGSMIAPAEDWP